MKSCLTLITSDFVTNRMMHKVCKLPVTSYLLANSVFVHVVYTNDVNGNVNKFFLDESVCFVL